MGRLRKRRRDFVRGFVLAMTVFVALSASAQEVAAQEPATMQNASRTETTPSAQASPVSPGSTEKFGEAGDQGALPQPSAPQSEDSAQSATQIENTQLAVNPLTGLVPVSALNYVPLTGKQRWTVYWKQTYFSYGAYFKPAMFALLLDQTTNSPSEWGGGFRGYGLRVASRTANSMVQGTIRAPLAAALHEDVRYVYSGQHSRKRRMLYAIEYSFFTYNDQHQTTLNVAKLVGYYASTAISTEWHRPEHSVVGYTFVNGSEQLALSVPINILQEFWPYISRRLSRLY